MFGAGGLKGKVRKMAWVCEKKKRKPKYKLRNNIEGSDFGGQRAMIELTTLNPGPSLRPQPGSHISFYPGG